VLLAITTALVLIECFVVYFWVGLALFWVNHMRHREGTLQVSPKRVHLV